MYTFYQSNLRTLLLSSQHIKMIFYNVLRNSEYSNLTELE